MKTPVDEVNFGEKGYKTEDGSDVVIAMPHSLLEGTIDEFQRLQAKDPPGKDATPEEMAEWQRTANRRANCFLFDLVMSWNVDDEKGKVLPLMSTFDEDKQQEERFALLSKMPVEFILVLAQKITGGSEVPEPTADFSSAS